MSAALAIDINESYTSPSGDVSDSLFILDEHSPSPSPAPIISFDPPELEFSNDQTEGKTGTIIPFEPSAVHSDDDIIAFDPSEVHFSNSGSSAENTLIVPFKSPAKNPFKGDFRNVQNGFNLYAYVQNNPLRFIDPFGLNEVDIRDEIEARERQLHNLNQLFLQNQFGSPFALDSTNLDRINRTNSIVSIGISLLEVVPGSSESGVISPIAKTTSFIGAGLSIEAMVNANTIGEFSSGFAGLGGVITGIALKTTGFKIAGSVALPIFSAAVSSAATTAIIIDLTGSANANKLAIDGVQDFKSEIEHNIKLIEMELELLESVEADIINNSQEKQQEPAQNLGLVHKPSNSN